MLLSSTRKDWLGNVRGDVLAGIVVALALIPEAIAFSIIAGVDPQVGLYSAFCIPLVMAFFGGRPAMISSSTGAMALLMVTLVKDHGLQYLLAASILTGVFQLIAGYLKLGGLMRFVSRSVVTGFVNALAILIFMAQLPELTNVTWHVYAMTAAGLGIIYLFPYINKTIPSPLVCIVVLTGIAMWLHLDVRTVGDMGKLPDSLPVFLLPDVPLNLQTLLIILPYSAGLAVVGLLESMMTATIVDDDRHAKRQKQGVQSSGHREHLHILYRRNGRLRDDWAICYQRKIRWTRTTFNPHGGRGAALPDCVPAQLGLPNSDGSAGRGDDYGFHRDILLALHCQPADTPPFNQRGHACHRRGCGGNT